MKKIFCIIVSIILILCLCGCRELPATLSDVSDSTEDAAKENDNSTLNLLCCFGDSFNPYLSKTDLNRQLTSLLYDSLVKTDNNFNAVYTLAESVEVSGNVCAVTLRDAAFSDGGTVTADDVVYSYDLAKQSPRYMHNFYEVVSVTMINSKTISFELTQHDPYFSNLLDFPILKSGSSGVTDADGKEVPPIGCGRYVLAEDALSLKQNENYYGKKGIITTVNLINSPDAASTSHYVEVGACDAYYTESDNIVRMSGKKVDVNLNRFIYIGINTSYGSLATKEMRYAISSALERDTICRTAYYSKALPATGFFHPDFKPTAAVQTIENTPNTKITVENLSKIGYNNMNSNGFYANSAGNNPVFSLIVNSENASRVAAAKLIAQQCASAGIQINIVECTYEQYLERLTSGSFHLYLGEVRVGNNMDFTQLVTPGGSAAYGITAITTPEEQQDASTESGDTPAQSGCESILASYHEGTCGISDVASTLLTEMPQIPICYINGAMFYSADIQNGVQASASDIYLNIENYEF